MIVTVEISMYLDIKPCQFGTIEAEASLKCWCNSQETNVRIIYFRHSLCHYFVARNRYLCTCSVRMVHNTDTA